MSKTTESTNGVTWRWIVGVLLAACGAMIMGYSAHVESEVENVSEQVVEHEAIDGHPVMVERVDRLQADVREIKTEQREVQRGVTELLRRVPPN